MELGFINGILKIKKGIKCKRDNDLVVEVIITKQGIKKDYG
jgi:hypothetical protein